MNKVGVILFFILAGIFSTLYGQPKLSGIKSPAGYDLGSPVRYAMPTKLLEISGIDFNNGDSKLIYAEQDEDGNIYSFQLGDKQVKAVKFGKRGDYEDVAIGNNIAVILRSDGELYSFPLKELVGVQISTIKKNKGLLPVGEYEGLHFDNLTGKLYALCKQCPGSKHEKTCDGYILNLAADGTISNSGNFTIDVKKISALVGKIKIKFHPSALAKNPLTRQWYILSSVNKLLVIADEQFHVQHVYPLSAQFLQPEGMAFDRQGNLYISNEGSKLESGNIMLFKYNGTNN